MTVHLVWSCPLKITKALRGDRQAGFLGSTPLGRSARNRLPSRKPFAARRLKTPVRPWTLSLLSAALLLLFSLASPLHGEEPGPLLRGAEIARALADGRPWQATMSDGHHAVITFQPDGGGRFELGLLQTGLTWKVEDDQLVLHLALPGQTKRASLRHMGKGLAGYEDGKLVLRLER